MLNKKEIFIKKANIKHNFKYDYSNVDYVDSLTKVKIICPIHGEFMQTPQNHLRGRGCSLCANIKKSQDMQMSNDFFIEKAKQIHQNKYDYSKTDLLKRDENGKIIIICPIHGEFKMKPTLHLKGQSCPKCKGKGNSIDDLIKKANEIHNNKYDYSKVIFSKIHDKVTIICPIHGEFEQTLSKHISKKQGCPKCAAIQRGKNRLMDKNVFFQKANAIHNNKYDYSKTVYNGMEEMITYICPIHGEIKQRPFDHLRGFGCYKCGNLESKKENEIFEFIKKRNLTIEHGNRNILNGKELDIFLPSKQIAIEYNGLRWHSEEFGRNKWYHLNKTLECNNKGIKLIQIFEDEYIEHKDIVLNKISHILDIQQDLPKVMGRKCKIEIISKNIAESFLNDYHIQGYARSTVYLGALYEDKLIAVMTFKQEIKNSPKWELTRFASDYHYICQGVGGKLFNWFVKFYNPTEIKSFADRRWTLDKEDNLYVKLGFKLTKELNPNYEYIYLSNPKKRIHKFNFRKQILNKKYGFPLSMTETEMIKELGYVKIWDCGLFKFIWKK